MSHLDWGSVPVWIATLVTSTSAALAVASYRGNLHDKEREQASKVSCRTVKQAISMITESLEGLYLINISISFRVVNRSDAPVYDLEVSAPPGYSGETLKGIELPPGVTATGNMHLQKKLGSKISPDEAQINVCSVIETPILTFTDALGRRWRKYEVHIQRVRRRTPFHTQLTRGSAITDGSDQADWTTVRSLRPGPEDASREPRSGTHTEGSGGPQP
jgi:hypothetical protein